MEEEVFLGIDVSKGYADFVLINSNEDTIEKGFQLTDNKQGRDQLTSLIEKWLKDVAVNIYCGLESTGGYENNWYYHLKGLQSKRNVFVSRLNPKAVKSTGDAKLRRTITDRVSAENIALYITKFSKDINYGLQHKHNEEFKEGRDILTGIRLLIKQRTQLSNQLEKWLYDSFPEVLTYCRNGIPNWLLRLLEAYPSAEKLSKSRGGLLKIKGISLAKAEELIRKANENSHRTGVGKAHLITTTASEILHKSSLIARQEKFLIDIYKDNDQVKLLTSIPGVGIKSAVIYVLEIEDVNRFDDVKKIVSFYGVHPTFKESGDGRWGSHMSKRGRGTMRAALFMCAKSGVRCNEALKTTYSRCRAKEMGYGQAMGAAMHKLLRIIYGVLKSNKPFDERVDRLNQEESLNKQKLNKENNQEKLKQKRKSVHRYQNENTDGPISGRKSVKVKKQMASQTSNLEVNAGLPSADTNL